MKTPIKHCIACLEIIKEGATICRHCGTSQKPQALSIFAKLLQWVGGTTAVISLVTGSIRLNSLHDDWLKKQHAIENYIAAAKFQYATGDFETADELLQNAIALNPTSEAALDFQVDVVMSRLEDYYSSNRRTDWVLTNKLYKDAEGRTKYDWSDITTKRTYIQKVFSDLKTAKRLALGLTKATGPRKAKILAHIAWHELLVDRKREDIYIENLFKEAITVDPHNAFARLMYSGWLMEYYKLEENPAANFSQVVEHLKQAKPSDDERVRFNSLMFKILSIADDVPQSGVEMLRLISRLEPRDITRSMAVDSLDKLASFIPKYDSEKNIQEHSNWALLNNSFENPKLIALAVNLGNLAFGCDPFDVHCEPNINVTIGFNLFDTLAFLYEDAGQYRKASEALSMAWLVRRRASWDADNDLLASMKRTLIASGVPARKVAVVVDVRKGNLLMRGDVVTSLNGIDVHTVDSIREVYGNIDKGQPFILTIVRNGVTQELNCNESPHRLARFADYVVPIDFLTEKNKQEHFKKIHAAWSSN